MLSCIHITIQSIQKVSLRFLFNNSVYSFLSHQHDDVQDGLLLSYPVGMLRDRGQRMFRYNPVLIFCSIENSVTVYLELEADMIWRDKAVDLQKACVECGDCWRGTHRRTSTMLL